MDLHQRSSLVQCVKRKKDANGSARSDAQSGSQVSVKSDKMAKSVSAAGMRVVKTSVEKTPSESKEIVSSSKAGFQSACPSSLSLR